MKQPDLAYGSLGSLISVDGVRLSANPEKSLR